MAQGEQNHVTFPSYSGDTTLEGVWHLPTSKATNGAVIVLHGSSYNMGHALNVALCDGAAGLGLTALRFNFRFVNNGSVNNFDPRVQGLDDLLGAFNFLTEFGKEIKPKRFYLLGKSIGGTTALNMAAKPEYAGLINGVGVLGLWMHSEDRTRRYLPDLSGLRSALFVLQGEFDPFGSPEEVKQALAGLDVTSQLEVFPGVGHSYEPAGKPEDNLLENEQSQASNFQKAAEITLKWLEEQDKVREDLRK